MFSKRLSVPVQRLEPSEKKPETYEFSIDEIKKVAKFFRKLNFSKNHELKLMYRIHRRSRIEKATDPKGLGMPLKYDAHWLNLEESIWLMEVYLAMTTWIADPGSYDQAHIKASRHVQDTSIYNSTLALKHFIEIFTFYDELDSDHGPKLERQYKLTYPKKGESKLTTNTRTNLLYAMRYHGSRKKVRKYRAATQRNLSTSLAQQRILFDKDSLIPFQNLCQLKLDGKPETEFEYFLTMRQLTYWL
ncbi:hypothetical protein ACFL96_19815 [Thermoproteota archaeon]